MSADFRQLAVKGQSGKAERLFRAAVSAYCALVRPTRRDANRLDDLAMPLFASVTPTARRFAAAALSECERAPQALVQRLADEPVEIAAPLLVRSPAISDVDLITMIGRHGLPHARAIARRPNLNPAIGGLLDAFKDDEIRRLRKGKATLYAVPPAPQPRPEAGPVASEGAAAENARRRLRAMMRPAGKDAPEARPATGEEIFHRLRETALSGHLPLFQTALADALGIDLKTARSLTQPGGYRALFAALGRLRIGEERAYLLIAALFPAAAGGAEAIRLFLYRYRLLVEEALSASRPAAATGQRGGTIRRVS